MNFVTFNELVADSKELAARMPSNAIGVLGVPRSGMFPATIMALSRHLHLGDVNTFAETGKFTQPGRRLSLQGPSPYRGAIVVVDDSSWTGKSMRDTRALLERSPYYPHHDWVFSAVYGHEESADGVDMAVRNVEQPRRFEWNLMNRQDLASAIVDIDGVLCKDPVANLEDNYDRYRDWVKNAVPLLIPSFKIGTLVTMRLGLCRPETEEWLERHGVKYGKLVMCDAKTPEVRRKKFNYGQWKGSIAMCSQSTWAIESCPKQAAGIADTSRIPVICTGDWRVYE